MGNRSFILVLLAITSAWLVFTFRVSLTRWECWDIGIDTAAWGQILDEIPSGKNYDFTCYPDVPDTRPRSIFSIHFHFWVPFFAVIYRIFSHPLILFFMMHIAHGAGAFLTGLMAHRLSRGDPIYGILATCIFLLVPAHALAQTRFDFSFRHFSLLLFPLAGLAITHDRRGIATAALLFLAVCEENLGFLAAFACFGLAGIRPIDRRWFIAWGTCFLVYPVIFLKLVIPCFMSDGFHSHLSGRYADVIANPLKIPAVIFSWYSLKYGMELLLPLWLMPLAGVSWWSITAIPFIFQNILSAWPDTRMIGHHYTTPLAVILTLAAIHNMAFFSFFKRRMIGGCIVGTILFLGVTYYPSIAYVFDGPDERSVKLGHNLAPLTGAITPDDSLSAPPAVCAHFCKRSRLWFFPQGKDVANVVVIPKYLPGYPEISEADLRKSYELFVANQQYKLIMENEDIAVFRNHL
ncbi:MAG: DUF2079 domain-containing protein [Candidatus Riflebacteria bacterium]|nr:DUF2079 domain-containing protein [Candidatus Riflebacteria bacterium]